MMQKKCKNENRDNMHISDSNDYSEQFAPLWKQFIISRNILIVPWVLFLLGAFFRNIPAIFENIPAIENILETLLPILFIPTFIWFLYFIFKLRCPKCNYTVFPGIPGNS